MSTSTNRFARNLAASLRRGGGRPARSVFLLTAAAVGAATLTVLLVLSATFGLTARINHTRWLTPVAADRPVAVQVTTTRYLGTRSARIVHLAPAAATAAETAQLPHPPGMDRFPGPGETWLSPALEDLTRRSPEVAAAVLGDPAVAPGTRATGLLGRRALQGPDDLVAVIGHRPDDPVMAGPTLRDLMRPDDHLGPVGVADFAGVAPGVNNELVQYRGLASIATVLLVVPALTLAAVGARLGAARRAARLARLRLAGLDRRTLVRVALADALPATLAGVVIGTLLHAVSLPLVARMGLVGSSWFPSDLLLPIPVYAVVWMAVLALVAASTLLPLRRILVDPVAVADHHATAMPYWWRLVLTVLVVVAFFLTANGDDIGPGVVIAVLALLFATLNVIGPLALGLTGRLLSRRARDGARLVAGRRILDDPKGAWRQVSSVALAAFIAGFLALFSVSDGTVWRGDDHTLHVAVAASDAERAADQLGSALRSAGAPVPVTVSSDGGAIDTVVAESGDVAYLAVPLNGDDQQRATIRRVTASTFPTAPQAVGTDVLERDNRYGGDFQAATIVVLAAAFVLAALGTCITATASVIDQRTTNRRLHRAGVPFDLLDRSRRIAVTAPALVATVGGAAAGLMAAGPVTLGSGGIGTGGVALLGATIALGVAAMRVGVRVSRPLLRRTAVA